MVPVSQVVRILKDVGAGPERSQHCMRTCWVHGINWLNQPGPLSRDLVETYAAIWIRLASLHKKKKQASAVT
jgi:hypothetical protein